MNLIDLKSDIVNKSIKSFYVFVGDEIGIINIYLEQIAKVKSLDIRREESVQDVWGMVSVRGMFASEPAIYVVRGDRDFQKQEKAWDNLLSELKDSVVILLYDKIDSRLKFGKYFKDYTVQFDRLDKPVLEKYVAQKLNITNRVEFIGRLVDMCGGSYDVCMLECDKLLTYQKSTEDRDGWVSTLQDCFKALVKDGTIYQSQETDVFQFVDAVCKRDIKLSFDLATRLIEDGASSINLLGTLYTSLRAILLIQCCTGRNIADITGLDNGAIFYNKKRTGNYSTKELVRAVKLISRTVDDIKSGHIDDVYATEYVLVCLL
jgi:DNA polymerase III delta subunit